MMHVPKFCRNGLHETHRYAVVAAEKLLCGYVVSIVLALDFNRRNSDAHAVEFLDSIDPKLLGKPWI